MISPLVILLVAPPKMTFPWNDGEAADICVRARSGTRLPGANIAPKMTGKRGVLFYLRLMLPILESN